MRNLHFLCIAVCFSVLSVSAQKMKAKDVRKAIEENQVSEIKIVCDDQFIPETRQEFDLQVMLQNGAMLLASDHHTIWDYAEVTASNTGMKIKGELLSNGKGLLVPHNLSMYYPEGKIILSVELAGKKDSRDLTAKYCLEGYAFERHGSNGYAGTSGSDGSAESYGSPGREGKAGDQGPDVEIQVEEEMVSGQNFMLVIFEGKKLLFDPSCSSVSIITRGGNGGDGGRGGNGGEGRRSENKYTGNGGRGGNGAAGGNGGRGGNIYLFGNASEKFKDKFRLTSEGGKGGRGGMSGRGGNGKVSGSSGMNGKDGQAGANGEVVFGKNNN